MAPAVITHNLSSSSGSGSGNGSRSGSGNSNTNTTPTTTTTNNGLTQSPTETVKQPPSSPKFPTSNAPRVWFLTAAQTPIGISLARRLLAHGDYICAGVLPICFNKPNPTSILPSGADYSTAFREFVADISAHPVHRTRLRVVALDPRLLGQCQSAVAEAQKTFGRIDVLFCCNSLCAVGTVEELGATAAGRMGVRDMFELNFFGTVNIIKSVLPGMRERRNGHVVALTGITGHLGTPGLGLYCASQWAVEGYCDSLAYEVAPFNIRTTIVQPNVEIPVLTNKIISAPPLPAYSMEMNGAPLFRDILSGLLDKLEGAPNDADGSVRSESVGDTDDYSRGPSTGDLLHQEKMAVVCPPLGQGLQDRLVAETVHAVASIGGHDNPPSRHIVGHEGVASVKEKLKTVSEEMEDFVDVSAAVDIGKDDGNFSSVMVT